MPKQSIDDESQPHGPEQTRVVRFVIDTCARLIAAGVVLFCHFANHQ